MSNLLIALLMSCLTSLAWAQDVTCAKDTTLIDFTGSFNKERMVFCQIKHNGKLVKHGPEIIYHADGSVKEKNFYNFGEIGAAPAPVAKSEVLNETNQKLDKIFDTIFDNLLGISTGKNILIYRDSTLCFNSPLKRLEFFIRGVPYDNHIKFAPRCFFQGVLKHEIGKKLSARYEVRELFSYNQLSFNYVMIKSNKGQEQTMTVTITDGKLTGPGENVNFTSNAVIAINVDKLLLSQGRTGVSVVELNADVSEVDGKPLNYHRSL